VSTAAAARLDLRDDGRPLAAVLRERLARPRASQPHSDYDLNPGMRSERPAGELRRAGVLIPIVARPDGATVLLTRRPDHMRDHAGQVAFPGGRVECADAGPLDAALREAEEEIGLPRALVEVVGALDAYETRTGFLITPAVGVLAPGFTPRPDPAEVAAVFEIPLALVLDPSNHQRHSREWRGTLRHFYVLPWVSHSIWGATAGMLVQLYRRLAED